MCGILGCIVDEVTPDLRQRIRSAVSALEHRGPDGYGKEELALDEQQLIFCHLRLAIIDLTQGGHQPKYSSNDALLITFNGEIYNYKELRQELRTLGFSFKTESDTEVLLACWLQWGPDCVTRLRGMFAFAIYDKRNKKLSLVRDGFGIKPLFYCLHKKSIYFSSEIPTLLKLLPFRPKHDAKTAYEYLIKGTYDGGEATFFNGILQLPPGHMLQVNVARLDNPEVHRWWYPSVSEKKSISFNEAVEQFRELLLDSIRLHMRSDVPMGAALSGGVDSSSIVCAMRYLDPKMRIDTFSFVARGSEVNEEKWVDAVNDFAGAFAHKVEATPLQLSADLDDLIRTQGEPFCGTSIYAQYCVYKSARENGVTVTLDGQGADELLGGYNGYPNARVRSLIDCGDWQALITFISQWSKWPNRSLNEGLRIGLAEMLPLQIRSLIRDFRGQKELPWIKKREFEQAGVGLGKAQDFSSGKDSTRGRSLVAALRRNLCNDGLVALLRHGDRNSMRWGVESRVPFLTTDLAEFCLTLPEHYLVSPTGETKHILKAAMRGIVPDAILDRRDKIGFATPEQEWFRQLGATALKWIEAADQIPFLDAGQAKREVELIAGGHKQMSPETWRLINYCRWAEIT